MRRWILLIAALSMLAAACGGDDDSSPEEGSADGASSVIVIEEIDFAADRIVLRNAGDAPYDLAGHWICNRPSYAELPAEVLEPGATTEIAASAVGLGAASGELAVYTAREFDSSEAMIRYVAWGSAGQGRQATATEAGLWSEDDFVDNAGSAIASSGDDPVSSTDWSSG